MVPDGTYRKWKTTPIFEFGPEDALKVGLRETERSVCSSLAGQPVFL